MTDVRLVKDCGLYSSYKKIIDFTGTKSQIITKQLSWIDTFNPMFITDANYNKFQNRLVLEMDYEEALTYTYAVMTDITGSGNKPMFFFVDEIENLTNGIEDENPNVAFTFTLDPVMTYMGEFSFAECMVDREHVDRWTLGSSLPKRITPNIEGASGFVEYSDDFGLSEEHNGIRIMLGVICVVEPSGKLKYYLFPYSPDRNLAYKINAGPDSETYPAIYGSWPTLQQIRTGSILDYFSIQPDSVAGIFLYPIFSIPITYSSEQYPYGNNLIVAINGESDGTYAWNVRLGGLIYYTNVSALYDASDDVDDIHVKYKDVDISNIYPVKPTILDDSSDRYEPSMCINPYTSFTINDGVTDLFTLPDNVILKSNGTLRFTIQDQISMTNGGTLIYVGNDIDEAIGNNAITFVPALSLEVGNDLWLQYSITSKDIDRQLVTNNAIKEAIDNLIYMGYGGALVGSRSLGKEGYTKRTPAYRTQNRAPNGRFTSGFSQQGGNLELTTAGRRVLGAVGIASGASIITSLVDAHVAWQNQLLEEKRIKNTASGLLYGGSAQSRITSGNALLKLIVRKMDSINYDKGLENYRKYGNTISKFKLPNTNTRLYYNYLLTNGSIVEGSINQNIRDTIASIFDAGVTIFHYDSGDTTTRNLEYTDKENIEVSLL